MQDVGNNANMPDLLNHEFGITPNISDPDHWLHIKQTIMFELIENLEVIWHGLFVKVLVNGAWHIEKVYNILYSKWLNVNQNIYEKATIFMDV